MKRWLAGSARNIVLVLLVAIVIDFVANALHSDYIAKLSNSDITSLLIALLAINITTITVAVSDVRQLSDKTGLQYTDIICSFKESVIEQIVLLVGTVVVQIALSSTMLADECPDLLASLRIAVVFILIWAVQILYDTVMGVFGLAELDRLTGHRLSAPPNNRPAAQSLTPPTGRSASSHDSRVSRLSGSPLPPAEHD